MSNDDFSFAFVAEGLEIQVSSRPSEDGKKMFAVTVNGKDLESYQYIDKEDLGKKQFIYLLQRLFLSFCSQRSSKFFISAAADSSKAKIYKATLAFDDKELFNKNDPV